MTTTPFDQVLTAARALPPRERARLIGQLAKELAGLALVSVVDAASADTTAWDDFAALAADPAVAEPLTQDSAVIISEMRR